MAQLRWDQVHAPNLNGAIQGVGQAGQLFNQGTKGLSDAIQQFGDQGVLAQLARFNDAGQLQTALADGSFDLRNGSTQAINRVMQRPGELIGNASNQQTFDQRAETHPLSMRSAQFKQGVLEREDGRSEGQRASRLAVDSAWNAHSQNMPATPDNLNAFVQQFRDNPEAMAYALDRVRRDTNNPEFGKQIMLPSNVTGFGGTTMPASAPPAQLPSQLQAMTAGIEQNLGIPSGVLAGIMGKEVGGRLQEFLADPAKYHYEPDSSGKRKSTAFGPFGILESTAKDPGYGVRPLQNKSLEEQARFAAEYAAARTKAEGGDWARGLDRYGTGVGTGYGQSILGGLPIPPTVTQAVVQGSQTAQMLGQNQYANDISNMYQRFGNAGVADMARELTGPNGNLAGVAVDDVRDLIQMVVAETGMPASAAAGLVQNAAETRDFTWFGLRDKRSIDKSRVESMLESIAGKKGKDGKYENQGIFKTLTTNQFTNNAFENSQQSINGLTERLAAAAQQRQAIANQPMTPGNIQALNQVDQIIAQLQQQQMGNFSQAGSQIASVVGSPPVVAPPVPVATQAVPSDVARARAAAEIGNFYSPERVEERARSAAERMEADRKAQAENQRRILEEQQERKKRMQQFSGFQQQAQQAFGR